MQRERLHTGYGTETKWTKYRTANYVCGYSSISQLMNCLDSNTTRDIIETKMKRPHTIMPKRTSIKPTKSSTQNEKEFTKPETVLTNGALTVGKPDFDTLDTDWLEKRVAYTEDFVKLKKRRLKSLESQLVSLVSTTLASEDPLSNNEGSIREQLLEYLKEIADIEPEFVLKFALYTRSCLNVSTLGNFILACAINNKLCIPHLKKYYSAIIVSPSDWIEVVTLLNFGHLTMKTLIRLLHIGRPVDTVFKLLGKRYPRTLDEFYVKKLPGEWNPEMAGKRMKFEPILTWQRELTLHGNNTRSWEMLIESNAIPYMAFLRNIRNILNANVSVSHIQMIIARLKNEIEVINSRQLPLRFYSAYAKVSSLSKDESVMSVTGKDYEEEFEHSSHEESIDAKCTEVDLNTKKNRCLAFMKAIDEAFRISAKFNSDPIPGNTIIVIDFEKIVREWNEKNLKPVILGLAISKVCEHSEVILCANGRIEILSTKEFVGLESVKPNMYDTYLSDTNRNYPFHSDGHDLFNAATYWDFGRHRITVATFWNVFTFKEFWRIWTQNISLHKAKVNPNLLFAGISTSNSMRNSDMPFDLFLSGFNDKILRFLCNKCNGHINQINNIDEVYHLRDPNVDGTRKFSALQYPYDKHLVFDKWKNIRIFVSSTFTDMHGERDMLRKYVFPELKARARKYYINIYDIDLRWGIVESTETSSTYLCLSEVDRCDIFVGILGDRYGFTVGNYDFPNEEKFKWLKDYPRNASITELEITQAIYSASTAKHKHAFFYFRDNSYMKDVPMELLHHFEERNPSSKEKLTNLKNKILKSGYEVYDGYPCAFGGVNEYFPFVTGLDKFAQKVFLNIWNVIQACYICKNEQEIADDFEEMLLETQIEEISQRKTVREETLKEFYSDLMKIVRSDSTRKLVALVGPVASGKTFFITKVIRKCCFAEFSSTHGLVIYYLCNKALIDIERIIRYLCKQLRAKLFIKEFEEQTLNLTYLLEEYAFLLKEVAKRQLTTLIIIDGLEQLQNGEIVESVSWLFPLHVKEITYLVTANENSALSTLLMSSSTSLFHLGELNQTERKELIRDTLCMYNKSLQEEPFCNQMRLLSMKKDSCCPFYLMLSCEELRNFGHVHALTDKIKHLPIDTFNLVKASITRIKGNFDADIVIQILSFLVCLQEGTTDKELYELLLFYIYLRDNRLLYVTNLETTTENLNENSCTQSQFFTLLQSLQGLLSPHYKFDNGQVSFAHLIVKDYVLKFLMSLHKHNLFKTTHKIIAYFYWRQCDPKGDHSWLGLNEKYFVYLPRHLILAECFESAVQLLTDVVFLRSSISIGLCDSVIENICLSKMAELKTGSAAIRAELCSHLDEVRIFLNKNRSILCAEPRMFFNIAKNESNDSFIYKEVSRILSQMPAMATSMLLLQNKDLCGNKFVHVLYDSRIPITASALSANKTFLLIATSDCKIHYYSVTTLKQIKTFIGHSDVITDLCFLGEDIFASSSYDGSVSVWDLSSGTRTSTLVEHTDKVCALANDNSNYMFASAGWDRLIVIRTVRSFDMHLKIRAHERPINVICFHPKENLIFSGSWDKTIKVWDVMQGVCVFEFSEQQSAITALSVSPCGRFIYSGSLNGDLKIWSAKKSKNALFSINNEKRRINKIKKLENSDDIILASQDGSLTFISSQDPIKTTSCFNTKASTVNCIACSCSGLIYIGFSNGFIERISLTESKVMKSLKVSEYSITKIKATLSHVVVVTANNSCFIVSCRVFQVFCEIKRDPFLNSFDIQAIYVDDLYAIRRDFMCVSYNDLTVYLFKVTELIKEFSQLSEKEFSLDKWKGLAEHDSCITSCSVSSRKPVALTATNGGYVYAWNIVTRNCIIKRKLHSEWINSIVFLDAEDRFATVSNECTLSLWSLSESDFVELKRVESQAMMSSLSLNSGFLMARDYSNVLTMIDAEEFTECFTFKIPDLIPSAVIDVCFPVEKDYGIKNPPVYIVDKDGYVHYTKLATWKQSSKLHLHHGACINFEMINFDEILTFGEDGLIKQTTCSGFHNNGKILLCNVLHFDASPSGKYLVTADDKTIYLWNISDVNKHSYMYKHETTLEKIKGVFFVSDDYAFSLAVIVAGDHGKWMKICGRNCENMSNCAFTVLKLFKKDLCDNAVAMGVQLWNKDCVETVIVQRNGRLENRMEFPCMPQDFAPFFYRGNTFVCCLSNWPSKLTIRNVINDECRDFQIEEGKCSFYCTCSNINLKMFGYPALFVGDSLGLVHHFNIETSIIYDSASKLHDGAITAIASSDRYVWTCSSDHSIKVWTKAFTLVTKLRTHNIPNALRLVGDDMSNAIITDTCKNLYLFTLYS